MMMMKALLLCLVAAAVVGMTGANGQDIDMSMYHTTEELVEDFRKLAASCDGMQVSAASHGDVSLPVVTLGAGSHRVLMFFGEHARELISPESALGFARFLCKEERGKALAAQAQFMLFPVVNVVGRKSVQAGDYCKRTNANNVDLNRNWGDHWVDDQKSDTAMAQQTTGGKKPFSEAETVVVRDAAAKFKPTIFITVHSGTLGMYVPYAWSGEVPTKGDVPSMLHIVRSLNRRFCRCTAGAAGKEVGYLCPGTCLDWIYDVLKTHYSFAFEIWESPYGFTRIANPRMPTEAASFVQNEGSDVSEAADNNNVFMQMQQQFAQRAKQRPGNHHSCFLQHPADALQQSLADHHRDAFDYHLRRLERSSNAAHYSEAPLVTYSDDVEPVLLQLRSQSTKRHQAFPAPRSPAARDCLLGFNPTSAQLYNQTIEYWTNVWVETIEMSIADSKKQQQQ